MNNLGPFRLEGDPAATDNEQVWLVWLTDQWAAIGDRAWPIWRSGWSAVFDPDLRIIDDKGEVRLTEGQKFWTSGLVRAKDSVYVCSPDAGETTD